MRSHLFAAALAASLALAGCGGGPDKTEESKRAVAETKPSGPPVAPDLENGATVTGKVGFEGAKPVPRKLDMSAVPSCEHTHPNGAFSEEVVINPNNTVRNTFVWVKSGVPNQNWQVPSTPVQIDQKGCMYVPHVAGVMAGQPVAFTNSDPANHNIHPMVQANGEWNESQPPGSGAIHRTFPKQEVMVGIKCNVHNWMRAYLGVVRHPFFAVTGDDGTYTIKGLPPGTYTIEIVHEKYGKQEQQITVGAKDSKTADFTIKG